MKVRIGIGVGRSAPEPEGLVALGQAIQARGFDSIWLSEVLSGGGFDPLVALSFLAARVPGLKLGTTMLLPGRNPFRLAKSLASLDRLSGGDLLVTFVPGLTTGAERNAVGVRPTERGHVIDEVLPLVRRLLAGESVDWEGPAGVVEHITVSPRPVQQPLEFWLGGLAPRSLERCGRLSDGWLPSFCTPAEASAGRAKVIEAASAAGREIDPEHFGVNLVYSRAPLEESALAAMAQRARGNDPAALIPVGRDALRARIESFVDCGISKFVARPHSAPDSWEHELDLLAADLEGMQT